MLTMVKEIKVMLVDDHEIFRDGISLLLSSNSSITLSGSVSSARELFDSLDEETPVDVFLLDINLPQMSGIELARKINQIRSHPKIIFLTSNTAKMFMESALRSGAKGFLTKDCSTEELVRAIERVAAGEYFFGKNIEQSVYSNYIDKLSQSGNESELTEREIEVLRCFANGDSYEQVANELNISKKTVEAHKKAVFEKLKFQNNADLVKYAIRHHIIEI
jgi:DNA-binding NarL/FixJ family response regulator